MIAVETAAWDTNEIGEIVQLVVRHVAHQMTPLFTAMPPASLINQNRHERSLPDCTGELIFFPSRQRLRRTRCPSRGD